MHTFLHAHRLMATGFRNWGNKFLMLIHTFFVLFLFETVGVGVRAEGVKGSRALIRVNGMV